jgi:hypothetical protein
VVDAVQPLLADSRVALLPLPLLHHLAVICAHFPCTHCCL